MRRPGSDPGPFAFLDLEPFAAGRRPILSSDTVPFSDNQSAPRNGHPMAENPVKKRTWTPPAIAPTQSRSAAATAAGSPQQSAGVYAKKLIGDVVLFGLISLLFRSWFPLALGAFLFFTNDDFIEWALAKGGISLVPNAFGAQFARSFIFLIALGALLANWKDALPAWLLPFIPFNTSWLLTAATAAAIAVLTLISAWVTRNLLPRVGIQRASDTLTFAIDGLLLLALLGLGFIASAIFG
jgi:hypothetical protein